MVFSSVFFLSRLIVILLYDFIKKKNFVVVMHIVLRYQVQKLSATVNYINIS